MIRHFHHVSGKKIASIDLLKKIFRAEKNKISLTYLIMFKGKPIIKFIEKRLYINKISKLIFLWYGDSKVRMESLMINEQSQ